MGVGWSLRIGRLQQLILLGNDRQKSEGNGNDTRASVVSHISKSRCGAPRLVVDAGRARPGDGRLEIEVFCAFLVDWIDGMRCWCAGIGSGGFFSAGRAGGATVGGWGFGGGFEG